MIQVRQIAARAGVTAVLLAVAPVTARSQNLVSNGSFELLPLQWTLNRNDCSAFFNTWYAGPAYSGVFYPGGQGVSPGQLPYGPAYSGYNVMAFGAPDCTPGISQNLTTIAGQPYALDFWVRLDPNPPETPNVFTVRVDGQVEFTGQVTNYPWQELSFDFIGTGSDVLSFAGNNPNGFTFLDDVSVVAVTPEPATITLIATGLVGMVGAGRRRRRKA